MNSVTLIEPALESAAERLDSEGWPIIPPTQITVHRTSPGDVRDRQVILSLDGERIGQLLYGQTLTREVAPGPHSLRAHNTLVWKTLTFDAPPGTHLHFTCINRAPRMFYFMLIMFGAAPLFLTLEPGKPEG